MYFIWLMVIGTKDTHLIVFQMSFSCFGNETRNELQFNVQIINNSLKEKENTQEFESNIKLHIVFINKFSFKSETCILKTRLEEFYY